MFGRKNKSGVDIEPTSKQKNDHIAADALDWEASRIEQVEKSEKRAWKVVWIEATGLVCLSVAIALMLPLKQTQPYVVKVDKSTGMTEILSVANAKDIPVDEMQDKFWLSQYIRSRESYDWRTVENDFIKTREMSTQGVFVDYAKLFEGKESLDKVLADKKRIVIELQSVVPNGNGIATVRYLRKVIDNASNIEESKTLWTASIGYEYQPNFKTEEANRILNPFGFKVTSYRKDPEFMDKPIESSSNIEGNAGAGQVMAPASSTSTSSNEASVPLVPAVRPSEPTTQPTNTGTANNANSVSGGKK